MSEIRCVYHGHEPNFPSTDQHPDAKRYRIAGVVVDAIGEPTEEEVLVFARRSPAAKAKIAAIEAETGFTRKQREFLIANAEGSLKEIMIAKELEISRERTKL